ncbi:MAG: 2-oxo acid dehydrogenase subunit E2, partial [Bdellovibrionales bacterium]|nr:2-oxo acid dehydrogenase subunit E2 [Bdellovibrionales bacterium]
MATEIKMPQLSDTMDSGKILEWRKSEGEEVSRGDILAEVETDKANLEIEAFQPGVLLKIVIPAGTECNVGEVIAVIGEAGESVSASNGSSLSSNGSANGASSHELSTPTKTPTPSPKQTAPAPAPSDRVKASPLAKKIAEQNNIDLSTIHGSGPSGRIVKKDLEAAPLPSQPTAASSSSDVKSPPSPVVGQTISGGRLTPFSKMRETIARRMQESVVESPHFYVTTSIKMKAARELRAILKEKDAFKGLSFNHMVIKAAAYGIQAEPRVNRSVKNGQVYEPDQINIGIITAIEDGLLIPVLKETDKLSLQDVVFEAKAAIERARAGRPNSTDLTGGTFSISNMGMFDVENFTAIINPGQGAVLAVSSIRDEPIVSDGQITIGQMMKVTISVDHRVIDGVMAGNFLKAFKEALEHP